MIGVGGVSTEAEWQGSSRFEILRRIGGGGMGIVYEAIDRETNARVALKTLRSMSADSLLLFKNEFRALADVRHPNLVGLGELFEEGGEWFFTMDLVDGEHFLAHVRAGAAPGVPVVSQLAGEDDSTRDVGSDLDKGAPSGFDFGRLRAALLELALGLDALHEANKVHCDIKPSNVLVRPSGQVVILDFGLITEAADPRSGERRVGTVAYMAPEQSGGERLGPTADWYAVGVVLYQALTGYLPIRGTAEEIAALKRIVEPPPPSAFLPSIPKDLDRLCVDLLRIDPSRRPSGREVLERLGWTRSETPTPPREPRFVGRTGELAALRSAYDEVRRGESLTILLSGESGVGKSAITKRFAAQIAASEGALVFRSRCHERESVPYKAVDGIVDAISHHLADLDAEGKRVVSREHASVLAQVFPVLRGAFGRTPGLGIRPFAPRAGGAATPRWLSGLDDATRRAAAAPLPGGIEARDPHERRKQLFSAMRELVGRLAARRPLVFLIDDLQWADADGLALLAHVMRPPAAPPVLLLGTVRAALAIETGARAVEPLSRALPGRVRVIELASLPPDEARRLAAELLGAEIDTSAVAAIAEEAGGHPLFIDELVRRRATRADDSVPVSLEEALFARIERLEPTVRRVLEALVVAGAPLQQETIARAVGADLGEFARLATELRAANLARTDGVRRGDLIEPYHDRLRTAVIQHLSPIEKRAWHVKLAGALEASASSDPEALAVHFREAGESLKAARYAAHGGDTAATALAFDRAARLYQMALELGPGCPEEPRWRSKLGEAFDNAGRGREAADAFLAAARLAPSAAEALDLRRRAAQALLYTGHLDRAFAALDDVLDAVGLHSPRSPKTALALLLARRAELRLRGIGFRERDASAIPRETLTRIDSSWAVGSGLGLVDNIRASYHQTSTLLLALDAGEPTRIARSLAGEVCFSSADGSRAKTRTARLQQQAESLAERLGSPYELAWVRASGGIAATLEGRWADALDACDRAEALFAARAGTAWEVGTVRWFAQWSLAYLGRIRELGARVPRGLRDADARGDVYGLLRHTTGLQSWTWLAADDPSGARARCQEALDRWAQSTFHVEHWWATLALRQIDLYEGNAAAALAGLTATWPRLSRSLLLMVELTELEALHLRARVHLLAAARQPARAKEHRATAARDAQRIRRAATHWATPLADLVDATVAAQQRDDDGAVALADRAARGLDAAGMPLYAAAARYRTGAIAGGDAGRALQGAARAFMESESIRNPEGFVAMLTPGFDAA